ncbi:MAG: hypothetical protein A3B68_06315 [Candidatus Melainabacteria bacterium RIFCSPHIGHO2_02_FULL_34_12]|nr:MAG: hypothetical protein A3B68_06315 [Candidatus Melainabacteria bacterium RIFCSPHIGHO2_02_FULL_34_12]
MNIQIINKSLIIVFCIFLFNQTRLYAADFIVPNSSGEPVVIDIANLNLISDIDVTIADFPNQPRPYRDSNTKSLVVFPPPFSGPEKTIVVRAGSSTVSKTISYRPSLNGVLRNSLLPSLVKARAGNTATKISDGRVVLIGGSKGIAESSFDSIEIFNPENGRSTALKTPNEKKESGLKVSRSQHSATYLGITEDPIGMVIGPVEQVLIVGGFSEEGLLESSIEIVEIKVGTNTGTSTLLTGNKSKLKKARIFHSANLLPNGEVLIIGGQGRINMTNFGALNSVELFDPISKSVLPSEITLNTPRLLHTSTTLQNGNILIVGGFTNEKQSEFGIGPATETTELIDVTNLSIKKTGLLFNGENDAVGGHTATLLTNGLVLIIGGSSDFFTRREGDQIEGLSKGVLQFYNPANESFNLITNKSGGNLVLQNTRFLHSSVLLPNGNIAVIGGLNIKAGTSTSTFISTPVTTIEVLNPDLNSFSGSKLVADQAPSLETLTGRILPTAAIVTPKNKTLGLLSASDSSSFLNSALYISGGFTNGIGKLPTKISELVQIESNDTVEGRKISVSPEAFIQGSYLSQLLVSLDDFTKVPSILVEPQTVNLSSSNSFVANLKVLTTNNENILLKSQVNDPNGSIVVSPSLFQVGEDVTIIRKDGTVQGEFEVIFLPADTKDDFIPAKLKVNVSDSAKPFLSSVPAFGVSLSNQAPDNTEMIQLKVFSQDGKTELTSVPSNTQVVATVENPALLNLGGTGISSVTGTLATQFTLNAIKPGSTNINFSISFPDVLSLSVPTEITGTPTFPTTPISSTTLALLSANGAEISTVNRLTPISFSAEDFRLSSNNLFPLYVPVDLQSSVDSSTITGLFTIRPVFGIDLLTTTPRTPVNGRGDHFRAPLSVEPSAIGGFVSSNLDISPVAVIASSDGLRTLEFDEEVTKNLDGQFNMINSLSDVTSLQLFEFGRTKIAALKDSKVIVLDQESGDVETSSSLSANGFEMKLTKIDNQNAAVVSVGQKGVDLIFPITDDEPRIVNFELPGITKNITLVEKLGGQAGLFAVVYDGNETISIVNLLDINASVQTISTEGEKISMIDFAGRYTVNGKVTDLLVASTQRDVLLFDLNSFTSVPVDEELNIKSKIEDLVVIDGIAYLALGENGIIALSIGALLNANDEIPAQVAAFKKNTLNVVKSNGKRTTVSKPLNAKILANSKPFLLSSGEGNDITIIRVTP